MILAIDFDQVLHDLHHPVPGRRMGPPMPGAVEAMRMLYDTGNTLIIHTVRAHHDYNVGHVQDWLEYYEIPYDEVTAIKPAAHFYIDDKAIKHVDWATTLKELNVSSNNGNLEAASTTQAH